MAQPTTGRQLVDLIQQSQLLDAALLRELEPQLTRFAETDPRRLAKTLIKNGLVTEYQARQLLAGRYKGFYVGKYKLLEVLGAGGMGKVFLAEQITMERLVAIKVLGKIRRPSRQKEMLARFKREAKAVAALNHPNIVHAYDFAEENGLPYIVMEFVEGIDTARLVGQFGPVAPGLAAEYIRQAAAGLQHAHKAGLVHRDVKPGNLLVDSEGVVKLLDLGLVSALDDKRDDSLTVDQDQLGTVDYIAPEQAVDSHNVDARADVYSLGATCYAILTGQPLYPEKSTAQKLILHQTEMPRPLRELRPDVPEELAAVVTRMLAKRPDDRPQTMDEVQQSLQPFSKPKQPPYDRTAIKIRREEFEPFLSKSPEAAQISVESLGKPESTLDSTSSAGARKTTGPASMIGLDSGSSHDGDLFAMSGEFTDLALTLPPPVRRVKKGSKKTKSSSDNSARWMALAGIAGGIAVMVLLSVVFFAGDAESTTTASVEPSPATARRTPFPIASSTYEAWLKYAESLRTDPKLVAHYRMLTPWGSDLSIPSDAGSAARMPLSVVQARWGDGRWPRKGAIVFAGADSGQYAAFSTSDTRKLDFQKPTTIALWFKVTQFNKPWQVLIGKGTQCWRLTRTEERSTLSFTIKEPPPQGKKEGPGGAREHRLDGRVKVDDGQWHLVVVCFNNWRKQDTPVVRMFIDGRADGRMEAALPRVNDDPVWVGASSDPKGREMGWTRNFHGLIDELIVWHRALSDDDVRALYEAGRP
ncbi:MAG: protein kinase [Planctomycetaceae bacterium]|nr:protein kinase [Planctomycetaceae bacterium]